MGSFLLVAKDLKVQIVLPNGQSNREGEYVVYDDLDMICQKLITKWSILQQTPSRFWPQRNHQSTRLEMQVIDINSYWPQLSLRLKTSLDYPNGPGLRPDSSKCHWFCAWQMPLLRLGRVAG